MGALILGAATLSSCAKDAEDIGPRGRLEVQPATLDFGEVTVGDRRTVSLSVGRVGLRDEGLTADWGLPFDPQFSFLVQDGPNATVDVVFSARSVGATSGALILQQAGAEPVTVTLRATGVESGLLLRPSRLRFPDVRVGEERTLTFDVVNVARQSIDVLIEPGPTLRACEASTTEALCVPRHQSTSVRAGSSLTHEVRFAPRTAGAISSGVVLVRSCPTCPALELPLEARAIAGALRCEPERLAFGAVSPGRCASRSVVCTNDGAGTRSITDLRIEGAAGHGFAVAGGTGPGPIAPGQSATIDVELCPTVVGTKRATLVIEDHDPATATGVTRVELEGLGSAADLEVTPRALAFTATLIAPTRRAIEVSNRGASVATIGQVSLEGGPRSPFSAQAAAMVLTPGASQTLLVEFQPTAVGTVRDRLLIASNDTDEPLIAVELEGTGLDLPPCAYEIAPRTLEFGDVEVGRVLRRAVEVRNVSASDCLVSAARMVGGSAAELTSIDLPSNAIRVPPGGRLALAVDFAPRTVGPVTGELELAISDPRAPYAAVPITARGSDVAAGVVPHELDFGVTTTGCRAPTRTLTLTSFHYDSLIVRSMTLLPVGTPFQLRNTPLLPATITRDQPVSFDVLYDAPITPQREVGALRIETSRGTWWVPLTGETQAMGRQVDRFRNDGNAADLLLVVDDSGSMFEEHVWLAENLPEVLDRALLEQIDLHVAVTTTDVDSEWAGATRPVTGVPAGRVFTAADAVGIAGTIGQLGTDGAATEQGLLGALLALTAPRTLAHNLGFRRPGVPLSVLVLSDEDDGSPGSPALYAEALRMVESPRHAPSVSVSVVVGPPIQPGCMGSGGGAGRGDRYVAVAAQTGGDFQSICSADWRAMMSQLAPTLLGQRRTFRLSGRPVASSIEVRVDGALAPEQVQWTYDAASSSVMFTPTFVPPRGAEVEIAYPVECL